MPLASSEPEAEPLAWTAQPPLRWIRTHNTLLEAALVPVQLTLVLLSKPTATHDEALPPDPNGA